MKITLALIVLVGIGALFMQSTPKKGSDEWCSEKSIEISEEPMTNKNSINIMKKADEFMQLCHK